MFQTRVERQNTGIAAFETATIFKKSNGSLPCVLQHDRDKGGPILIQLTQRMTDTRYSEVDPPSESLPDNVFGKLDNGLRSFVLLNVKGLHHAYTLGENGELLIEETLSADFILYGATLETLADLKFNKVRYVFSNLIQLGEHPAIAAKKDGLQWGEQEKPLLLYENTAADPHRISYLTASRCPFPQGVKISSDEILLRQKGTIEISTEAAQPMTFFDSKIGKFEQLVSFLSLGKIHLEQAFICREEGCADIEVYRSGMLPPKDTFDASEPTTIIIPGLAPSLSFDSMVQSGSFKLFFENYDNFAPVFECILPIIYANDPVSSRFFVDLMRALEIIHKNFYFELRIADLKAKAEKFDISSSNVLSSESDVDTFFFGKNREEVNTESRFSLRHIIANLITPDNKLLFHGGSIDKYFPYMVTETRNYYVHDTRRRANASHVIHASDKSRLWSAMSTLLDVLDWHIMHNLNIDVPCAAAHLRTILTK